MALLGMLSDPYYLAAIAILFFTSMPVHEWAHAWAAYQLGDDTASMQGRLTLNPLAHIDPMGLLSWVIAGFGWGKPVPVNPYRLRGSRRTSMMLVGIAGPFSNLVMATLASIPMKLGWIMLLARVNLPVARVVVNILYMFVYINLVSMLFNLIPVPPLDGSRVLVWLLPPAWANLVERVEMFGGMGMMLVVFLMSRLGLVSLIINPLMDLFTRLLGWTY